MSIICVIMFQIYKTFLLRTNSWRTWTVPIETLKLMYNKIGAVNALLLTP